MALAARLCAHGQRRMTGVVERGRAWRVAHPAVAEVGVAVAAAILVTVVAVSQWGATQDALLRGLTLGTWLGVVVWLVARRRRVAEERVRREGDAARSALRLELARELHDTLAGAVAAIGIQAAAARRVMEAAARRGRRGDGAHRGGEPLGQRRPAAHARGAAVRRRRAAHRGTRARCPAGTGPGADAGPSGRDQGGDRRRRCDRTRCRAGSSGIPDRRGGHPQRPAPRRPGGRGRDGEDRRGRAPTRGRERPGSCVRRRGRVRPRARRHARARGRVRRIDRRRPDAGGWFRVEARLPIVERRTAGAGA